MQHSQLLPVRSFESLLWAEEVEERVEFSSWYASGEVTCNDQGCEGTAKVGVGAQ